MLIKSISTTKITSILNLDYAYMLKNYRILYSKPMEKLDALEISQPETI